MAFDLYHSDHGLCNHIVKIPLDSKLSILLYKVLSRPRMVTIYSSTEWTAIEKLADVSIISSISKPMHTYRQEAYCNKRCNLNNSFLHCWDLPLKAKDFRIKQSIINVTELSVFTQLCPSCCARRKYLSPR